MHYLGVDFLHLPLLLGPHPRSLVPAPGHEPRAATTGVLGRRTCGARHRRYPDGREAGLGGGVGGVMGLVEVRGWDTTVLRVVGTRCSPGYVLGVSDPGDTMALNDL